MKFKANIPSSEIRINKISTERAKKLCRIGKDCPRIVRNLYNYPVRNYSAEAFRPFDRKKKKYASLRHILSRVLLKIKSRKKRKHKGPLLSNSALLGAFCGTLSICMICGAIVIYSLFFRLSSAHGSVDIPNLVSLTEKEATAISNDIFEFNVNYRSNPDKPSGTVTEQIPPAGVTRRLYRGKKINITLIVNTEHPTFVLPDISKMTVREATVLLKNAGINVYVTKEYSTAEAGTIIYSSLPKGSVLSPGDSISLRASIGKETQYYKVPDLLGMDEYEALSSLSQHNFEVGEVSYKPSKFPIGTVIAQNIAPNSSLPEKSKISFTLSGGIYYQEEN